jgi:hypothetical protein
MLVAGEHSFPPEVRVRRDDEEPIENASGKLEEATLWARSFQYPLLGYLGNPRRLGKVRKISGLSSGM